jgi:hypothetical protein
VLLTGATDRALLLTGRYWPGAADRVLLAGRS